MKKLNEESTMPSSKDKELIAEFKHNPIGHHSPDLQRLLNRFRGVPMKDKFCLLVIKPNRLWQLAKTSGVAGKQVKKLPQTFTNQSDAEWYVFRKRWKSLTGETLKP
jgi:branched-chain amino acid transport system permease protein